MTANANCNNASHRLMFRFWLDIVKDAEYHLAEYIMELKHQRQFASTIRDSLRLIMDLREGRTDALLEMFPFVREAIQKESRGIEQQLTRLEKLLLDTGNTPIAMPTGPKAMNIPALTAPIYDDDDTLTATVLKVETDGKASAANFLKSAFALLN